MKLLNIVVYGTLDLPVFLSKPIGELTLREKLPRMLHTKIPAIGTLLIFENGKFRIMGKGCTIEWVSQNITTIGEIKVQTYTYVYNLNMKINLGNIKLSKKGWKRTIYTPELFSSRIIYPCTGGAINAFNSGKLILLGKKTEEEWKNVIECIFAAYIYPELSEFQYVSMCGTNVYYK